MFFNMVFGFLNSIVECLPIGCLSLFVSLSIFINWSCGILSKTFLLVAFVFGIKVGFVIYNFLIMCRPSGILSLFVSLSILINWCCSILGKTFFIHGGVAFSGGLKDGFVIFNLFTMCLPSGFLSLLVISLQSIFWLCAILGKTFLWVSELVLMGLLNFLNGINGDVECFPSSRFFLLFGSLCFWLLFDCFSLVQWIGQVLFLWVAKLGFMSFNNFLIFLDGHVKFSPGFLFSNFKWPWVNRSILIWNSLDNWSFFDSWFCFILSKSLLLESVFFILVASAMGLKKVFVSLHSLVERFPGFLCF